MLEVGKVTGNVVVVGGFSMQQSAILCARELKLLQLSVPHLWPSAQSESLSQSPSPKPQGLWAEQHDQSPLSPSHSVLKYYVRANLSWSQSHILLPVNLALPLGCLWPDLPQALTGAVPVQNISCHWGSNASITAFDATLGRQQEVAYRHHPNVYSPLCLARCGQVNSPKNCFKAL